MKIGVITHLRDTDADAVIKKVHELGIEYCQLGCWNHSILTPELAEAVTSACLYSKERSRSETLVLSAS